jgi:hypothetical protein
VTAVPLDDCIAKTPVLSLEKVPDVLEVRKVALERDKFPIAVVEPGQAAWVPYGQLPLVVSTQHLATFLHIPYLSAELFENASEEVKDLVSNAAAKYLRTSEAKAPWTGISAGFGEFKHL